ncbi:MAG: hypothetical protein WCO77_07595 [bacterium]
MTGGAAAWIPWSLLVFIVLTRLPGPPRTAVSRREHFAHAMSPVAAGITFLALTGLLVRVMVFHAPFSALSLLAALAATAGIALIPIAFGARLLHFADPWLALARFMSGIALASCWPAAWENQQALFILGSVCALLPDTLDQWVSRFITRSHLHIAPDPLAPDAQLAADTIAMAMTRCLDRREPLVIQFYPGQTQAGKWHRYTLRFNNEEGLVVVTHGDTVTTAAIPCRVTTGQSFTLESPEGILSMRLEPAPNGRISLRANPWERNWSHSLILGAGLGVVAWVLWGVPAGLIAGGAIALHALADQLGFSDSGLLFPVTRNHVPGLQLLRPAHARLFNCSVSWLALLITGWNGARILLPVTIEAPPLIPLLLLAGALPIGGLMLLAKTISPAKSGL